MKRFQNILLVADDRPCEAAIDRAVVLARENRARLTVVAAHERFPHRLQPLVRSMFTEEPQELIARQQQARLDELVAPLKDEDLEVRTKAIIGTPFIDVIREVIRGKHDLVMKLAEGKGGSAALFLGTIDMRLLRKCPCPVWIIKPAHRKPFSRILAAVDPDPSHPQRTTLNQLIMDLATSLAKTEGSELHVVHAWSLPGEQALRRGRTGMQPYEVENLLRATREVHRKWMGELLVGYGLDKTKQRIHQPKGDPGVVIPSLARKIQVELIVMGTVARTGLPGFFIGNTAENVLRQVDCSVLAVKPEGFVTPVNLED